MQHDLDLSRIMAVRIIVILVTVNLLREAVSQHASILDELASRIRHEVDEFGSVVLFAIPDLLGGIIHGTHDMAMVMSDTSTRIAHTGNPGSQELGAGRTTHLVQTNRNCISLVSSDLHSLELLSSVTTLKRGEVNLDIADTVDRTETSLDIGFEPVGQIRESLLHEVRLFVHEETRITTDERIHLIQVLRSNVNAGKEVTELGVVSIVRHHIPTHIAVYATLDRMVCITCISHCLYPPFHYLLT